MIKNLDISCIKIRIVDSGSDGLLAWASCVVSDAVKLDNIAIRRSRDGSLFLTYPAKRTADGVSHQYFHPISIEAAQAIENSVLTRLAALAMASTDKSPESVRT